MVHKAPSGPAAALVRDAIAHFGQLGDVDAVAACLRDLAMVLKEQGRPEAAAALWSSGNALSQFEPNAKHSVFERDIGDLPEIEAPPGVMTIEVALAMALATDAERA